MERTTRARRRRPWPPLPAAMRLLLFAVFFFFFFAAAAASVATEFSDADSFEDESTPIRYNLQTGGRCSIYCRRDKGRLKFAPDTLYKYSYSTTINASVTGSLKANPGLKLEAVAYIETRGDCDQRLKLESVRLLEREPDGNEEWTEATRSADLAKQLERLPLDFAYEDGRITSLCPREHEPTWALNIKRGLLSALQSSGPSIQRQTSHVMERDVSGLCLTSYMSFEDEWRLRKFKDLTTCTQRSKSVLPLPDAAVPTSPGTRSPLRSYLECRQDFEESGHLKEADCKEWNILRPFSNGDEGAITSVKQNLKFVSSKTIVSSSEESKESSEEGYRMRRSNLLFESEEQSQEEDADGDQEEEGEAAASALLRALGRDATLEATASAPVLLRRLRFLLRKAPFPALQRLYQTTRESPVARRLLLDALPSTGSAAAASLAVHLYYSGELSGSEIDSWMTSMALQTKPTNEELTALLPLLVGKPRPRVMLAAGALVYAHCGGGGVQCRRGSAASEMAVRLERRLGARCLSGKDENGLIVALKAVGNAGLLSVAGRAALRACYMNRAIPIPVRVSALEALRRVPCSVTGPEELSLLMATGDDAEVRIAAYQAAMRCPTPSTLRRIRDAMAQEGLSQVSSFVWSHLENIEKSSYPWKQAVKDILSDDFVPGNMSAHPFKYSRNYDFSTHFDSIDAGLGTEGSVLFSSESYLPRSAKLNLTVDVFGQYISLFELGARAEGFEKLVEDIFGPKGFFPKKTIHDLLASLKSDDQEMGNSIRRIGESFAGAKKLRKDPRASVYARLFGHELGYASLEDLPEILRAAQGVSAKDFAANLLKERSVDLVRSFSLAEASHVVPTCAGLPLALALNGSGLVRARVAASLNASGDELHLDAELAPSAALAVDASMGVDARFARVGARVEARVRASTYMGGSARFAPGRLAHVTLRAPREQLHVLDASSKVFYVTDKTASEVNGAEGEGGVGGGGEACTPESVSTALGVRACASVSFRNASSSASPAPFPLSGGAALRVAVSRTDSFERYEAQWEARRRAGGRGVEVWARLATPGSRVDRTLQLSGRWDPARHDYQAEVRWPRGGAELLVVGPAHDDEERLLSARASLRVGGDERLRVLTALRVQAAPHRPLDGADAGLLRVGGGLAQGQQASYHVDVVVQGGGEPISLTGKLSLGESLCSVHASVSCPLLNGTIDGSIRSEPGSSGSDLRLTYYDSSGNQQHAAFSHELINTRTKAFNASLEASQYPQLNTRVEWELRRDPGLFRHRFLWDRPESTWHTIQHLQLQRWESEVHLKGLLLLTCPQRKMDYKIDVEHKATGDNVSLEATALLGPGQLYEARVRHWKAQGPHVRVLAEVATPSVRGSLEGGLERKDHQHHGSLVGELQLANGRKSRIEVSGVYKHSDTSLGQEHRLNVRAKGLLQAQLRAHLSVSPKGLEHSLQLNVGDTPYAHSVFSTQVDGKLHVDFSVMLFDKPYNATLTFLETPLELNTEIVLHFSKEIFISTKFTELRSGMFEAVEFEINWDKNVHPENYVYFKGTFNSVKFVYPSRSLYCELQRKPGSIETELTWDEENTIRANMNWAFTLNKGHVVVVLTTPFVPMLTQNFSLEYAANRNEAFLQSGVVWSNTELNFLAKASRNSSGIRAEILLETPEANNMTLRAEHVYGVRSELFVLNGVRNATVVVDWGPSGYGYVTFVATGNMLPGTASMLYMQEQDIHRGEATVTWRDWKPLVASLSITSVPIAVALNVSTPFDSLREGTVDFKFKSKSYSEDSPDSITWCQGQLDMISFKTKIHSDIKFENHEGQSSLEMNANLNDKTLNVVVRKQVENNSMNYRAVVSGPVDFEFRHSLVGNRYNTNINMMPTIHVNHLLYLEDTFNWENTLHVNTSSKSGFISFVQTYKGVLYSHVATVQAGTFVGKVKIDYEEDERRDFTLNCSLETSSNTPVQLYIRSGLEPRLHVTYPQGQIKIDAVVNEGKEFDMKGELRFPGVYPMMFYTVYKNDDILESYDVVLQWQELETREIRGSVTNIFDRNRNGDVNFKTDAIISLDKKTIMGFNSTYGMIYPHLAAKVDAAYGERTLNIKTDINTDIGSGDLLNIEITTSGNKYMLMSTLGVNPNATSGSILFQKNDRSVKIYGETINGENHHAADIGVVSIHTPVPNASLEVHFDARDVTQRTAKVACEFQGDRTELSWALKQEAEDMAEGGSLELTLKTPLKNLESANAIMRFVNKQDIKNIELTVEKGTWRCHMEGTSSFSQNGSSSELIFDLPFENVKIVKAFLKHTAESPNEHSVAVELATDRNKHNVDVSLAMLDGEKAAFLDARSTLDSSYNVQASFNLAGDVEKEKKLLFKVLSGSRQMSLSGTLSVPSLLKVRSNLDVNTTFEESKFLAVGLDYDASEGSKNKYTSLLMNVNGELHSLLWTLSENNGKGTSFVFMVNSSFSGNLQATSHYIISPDFFQATACVVRDSSRTVLEGNASLSSRLLSVELASPLLYWRSVSLQANWDPKSVISSTRFLAVATDTAITAHMSASEDFNVWFGGLAVEPQKTRFNVRYKTSEDSQAVMATASWRGNQYALDTSWNNDGVLLDVRNSAIGGLEASAYFKSSEDALLKVHVYDTEDSLLHGNFGVQEGTFQMAIESRYKRLKNQIVSICDIVSLNHDPLEEEHTKYTTDLPFSFLLSINKTSAAVKAHNFWWDTFYEEYSSMLDYSLSYLQNLKFVRTDSTLVVSINRTKVFESKTEFIYDIRERVAFNFIVEEHNLRKKLEVQGSCQTFYPPELYLTVQDEKGSIFDLRGEAFDFDFYSMGFTYKIILNNNYGFHKRSMLIDYYPNKRMAIVTNSTTLGGVPEVYRAKVKYDKYNGTVFAILETPIQGYEKFSLDSYYEGRNLTFDLYTSRPGFEHISGSAVIDRPGDPLTSGAVVQIAVEFNNADNTYTRSAKFEYGRLYLLVSYENQGKSTPLSILYDFREQKKVISALFVGQKGEYAFKASGEMNEQFRLDSLLITPSIKPIELSANVGFSTPYGNLIEIVCTHGGKKVASIGFTTTKDYEIVFEIFAYEHQLHLHSNIVSLFRSGDVEMSIITPSMSDRLSFNVKEENAILHYDFNVKIRDNSYRVKASADKEHNSIISNLYFKEIEKVSLHFQSLTRSLADIDVKLSYESGNSLIVGWNMESKIKKWIQVQCTKDFNELLNINGKIILKDNENWNLFAIQINAPLKNSGVTLNLNINFNDFLMKSALKWGHGKEVHVQVSYFMNYTKAVADFSFQSTDLGTFIFSTNTSIDDGIQSDTKVQVGESELELGIILSYNSTITLKTPFKGYSFIQINVNFDLKDDMLMITTDAAKEDYFLNTVINCTATRYHADGYLKLAASGWGEASAYGALDYEETVEFRMSLTRDRDEWSLHLRTSPFTNGSVALNLETSSLIQGSKSQTSLSGKYEKENLETSRFLLRRNDAEDIIDLKVHYAHDDDQMYISILDSKSDVVWLNFGYVMSETERSVRFSWKPHQDTSSISLIVKSDEKFLIDAYLKLNSTMGNIFALANINRSSLDGKFRINEHTLNYEVRRWKDNITINLVIDSVLISKCPLHGRFELSRNAFNLHAYMTGFEDKALDQIWEGEDELSLRVAVNLPGMHVGLRGLSNNEMEVGSIIGIWKETMVANKIDIKLSTIVNDMLLTVSTPWTHTLSMKGQILEKEGVVANYHINYHEFETSSEISLSQTLGNIQAELRVGRNWVMLLQGKYTEEEFMANLHTPWENAKECVFSYTHRESNTSLERELDVTSCIFPRLYSRLSVQRNSTGSNVDLSVSYHHKNISAEVFYDEDFMVLMGSMESPWLDATLELRAKDTWVAAFYVTKLSDSPMGFEARLNSTNFYSSLQFPILKTKVYVVLHNEDHSTRSIYFDYSYSETRGKYNITVQNKPYIIFVVDTSHNTSVDSSYVQLEASLKERFMMVNTGWKIFQFEKSIRGYINVSDNAIETEFEVLQPGIEPWTFAMEAGGSEQIFFLQIGTDYRFVMLPGVCEIHILDQTHALKYDIDSESSDRFTGKFELISPLIAPLELRVEFKRNAENMSKADIAFFCGERNYTITFAFGVQPRLELDMNILMDTEKLLQVSSAYNLQKDELDFVLRFRDMESRVEIKHRSQFPVNSYFRIKSPFLLRNTPVYGHMHMDSETLTIEVGRGEEEGRRFIRLDGNLRLDKGDISVHFKSPFYSHLRSFGLEGHMNTGENSFFSTTANIILSDSSTLTASIGSHFTKDESLDALALVNFNLPNHKEEYGANIHIPLRFGYSATFNTTLSIPDLYYSLEASYSFAQDEFNIFAQARGKETLLRMLIQAEKQPSFYLTAEFDSPLSGFEHYLLRLGEKSDATVHFIEWGEQRIELRHHFMLEKDAFLCTVELNTPFQNHERYGMHVEYQNKARKIGIARIRYPGLKKDLGVELDFLVNGIFDVKVEAKFHAPLSEKFQSGTVSLTHRASSNHYEIRILGEYNSRVLGAEMKVTGSISEFVLELKGRRDDSISVLLVDTTSPETKRQRVRLEITSPLPALRHLEVDVDASYAAVYVAVIHNNVTYVDLKMDSTGKIVFINPLKSLLLEIQFGKQTSVELGWESNGELKSRLGLGVIYSGGRYRRDDTLFIRIPSQENPYMLKVVQADTENGMERAYRVFWGKSTLGVSVLVHRSPTNTTGLLRLDLPARSFEASASIVHGDRNLTHDFEFLWDAARNRSAAIGYRVRRLDEHSVSLTVRHPLLGEEGASVRARLKLLASRRLVDVDAHLGLDYHSKQQFFASAALYASPMDRLSAGFSLDHPASLLSVVALAEISRESTKVRAKYSVVYRTPSVPGDREVFGLAQTSLEPPSLLLKARTNEAALRLRARIVNCSADASLALDDRKPLRLRVRLLEAERAVEAALDLAGGELRYRARAALPHWRRASVEVWRQGRGGAHTRELGAAVSLSGSRQLWAAARWRPRAVEELRPALQAELEELPDVATLLADGHARLARERWTLRVPAPDVRPLAKYGRQQVELINADIRQMFDSARRVYESNKEIIQEFANDSQSWLNKNVLRSLLHVVLEVLLETCRVLERFVKLCNEALSLDQFVQTSFDCLVRIQKRLKELMASAQTHLVEITKTFVIVASALLDEFKEYFNEQVTRPVVAALWNYKLAMASAAKIIVTRYLEFFAHFENLFQLNEISEIAAYYSDVINWLESGNFTREVKSYTDQVIQLLLNDLETTLDHLRLQIEQSAPPLLPVLTHIYHKLEWAWDHYNIGAKILSYLINVLDDAKEELQTDYFKFDPEKGYLRYSQKLPVDWESFDQLPRFEQLTSVTSPSGSASLEDRLDLFNDVSYTESVINKTLASILPSFTQTGLLVGMKHIVTFDGLSYELKGKCSYLLSADLLHYSYAIIVHYYVDVEDKLHRSFTIVTQDHRVDISSDYSVRADERSVELPAHLSDALRVARTEDSVELQAAPGVSFRCHVRHHVCSVRLSGWLFGRTAGLLGSFDRDRADDVEWSHAEEPEETWRLGFCAARRFYFRYHTTPSTPSTPTTPTTPLPHVGGDCARMFRAKGSPLRACARLVDPTPFERLCASAGACEAAMAYREMCRQQAKITVRAPAFCESCRLPGGRELPSEETAVLPASAGSAVEVVYVVEKGCSQPFNVSDAVDELEKALAEKGFADVQYAVVGYGGVDAPEPQLHTAPGGRIWFGEHVLKKTLMRLKWSGGRAAADPAAAVAAAAGLRQRAMSGRLVVLLKCSAAPSEQQSSPLRRLPAGVQLHVLRPGPVVHEAPPHTVGLDGKHLMVGPAYETSFAVRPFPDNTLENIKENDMCGWAAIESGGTVFDSSLTMGALDAWAGRVASDVHIPQCRRVSCGPGAVVLCNEHNSTPQTSEEDDVEFESFLGLPKRGKEINNSFFVDL